jgi:hypothetical protein
MKNSIGETAGKVWHALNEHGPRELSQLVKLVQERDSLVYAAVGWLAREEKIDLSIDGKKVTVTLSA